MTTVAQLMPSLFFPNDSNSDTSMALATSCLDDSTVNGSINSSSKINRSPSISQVMEWLQKLAPNYEKVQYLPSSHIYNKNNNSSESSDFSQRILKHWSLFQRLYQFRCQSNSTLPDHTVVATALGAGEFPFPLLVELLPQYEAELSRIEVSCMYENCIEHLIAERRSCTDDDVRYTVAAYLKWDGAEALRYIQDEALANQYNEFVTLAQSLYYPNSQQ
jgi:hypothetical protein